jgi:hypothetical protein
MSSETTSELRLMAITLWHYQNMGGSAARLAAEATEKEQALRIERFHAELIRIFGDRADIRLKVNGGCVEAVLDDLRFLTYEFTIPRTKELRTMVSLLGRCPSCGVETMSRPFADLPGLGRMLEEFEPTYEYFCPTRQKKEVHHPCETHG